MRQDLDRKPIVWAFSTSRLRHVFESVAPTYADRADVRVFHSGFEEALATARELTESGEEVDAFIAAGANAAYLRDHAAVPVSFVRATTLDALEALARARRLSPRVGVVNFRKVVPGLDQARQFLTGLELEQRPYLTLEEARAAVADLAARGFEVVVGTGPVCDLAERAGLQAVLLYSQDSVAEAISRAVEIARIARAEELKRERLQAILAHLEEAVLAVDLDERIRALNPAMERLLDRSARELEGQRLSEVAPALGATRVLETGAAELDGVARLGARTLVVHRRPLRERGQLSGAVLTCQDATSVQRLDRTVRAQHRPSRFVARHRLDGLVGGSPAIARVRALAARYARTDATVLITGESGTGKEVVAQGIHNASTRRDHPFVAINCAAFPETLLEGELFGHEEGAFTGARRGGRPGLFESAHRGTLFLDEVGDVPLTLQTRLLRVLQERQVLRLGGNEPTPIDVRVIAATHRDLPRAVEAGQFRGDLYYRLAILPLHLPPLRERGDDAAAIAGELLTRALLRHGVPAAQPRALSLLLPLLGRHAWPGNVRELENVVERVAVLFADRDPSARVNEEELRAVLPELHGAAAPSPALATAAAATPAAPAPPVDLRRAREEQERSLIRRTVAECGGNQAEAARRLGIGRSTLWRKLNGER
ncbi:propionate catabolism operon regulatory protein PrpR [Anaeromyxobacter paludicola]|uniref:Propionate catabolism operon regulatory protein PrpR n=1 Tax=Anaeromyxobacter paludicola TaxID=2918171 RepID=A0ABN6NDP0_9BACT|nr:propionate catabolism operon regulatory protein PrpR [Anaeromyxobacter paludicola]BDG10108.1 propionate catabolism operon regulatory protein PrpR [Anaeromyxobacter paludicola]